MKKLLCAFLFLAMLTVPVMGLIGTALVDDDAVIMSLLPDKNTDASHLTLEGCEVSYGSNGEVIFTLTAATAKVTYIMMEGTTLYAGSNIDLSNDAFCAVDYGTADGVTIKHVIFHYTRKDKPKADLYLYSMQEDTNYAQYRKAGEKKDNGGFAVWDWGTYVRSSEAKLNENKIHNFIDTEMVLEGTVGAKITFYTAAITNTADLPDLGADRPEPTVSEPVSSAASSETSDTSAESSAVSEETSEVSDESDATSAATSSTASENTSSAATSSKEASSNTSSKAPTSSEPAKEEGGLSTGAIIGIVCGVVAVIAVVVVVVIVMKKKKG